jgi:hypothetical protein
MTGLRTTKGSILKNRLTFIATALLLTSATLPAVSAQAADMQRVAPQTDNSQIVSRFEQQLASFNPRSASEQRPAEGFSLPVTLDDRQTRANIVKRINVTIEGSRIETFSGQIDGQPALFIKSADSLHILSPDEAGMKRYTFSRGKTQYQRSILDRAPRGVTSTANDEIIPQDAPPPLAKDGQARGGKKKLRVFAFLHDDVGMPQETVYVNHLAWWAADLDNKLSDELNGIEIRYIANMPGYTNFDYYVSDSDTMLNKWKEKVQQYKLDNKVSQLPDYNLYTNKFILLTRNAYPNGVMGIAFVGGDSAWSSLLHSSTAAHELGHTLRANHESAEILYRNGWWCETNVYPEGFALRSACQIYSDANIERIKDYLDSATR